MTNEYREAFTEVNEILKYLDEHLVKKIPKEFIDNIKENKSKSYELKYDNTKGLNENNLKMETRAILSVIYRDYICDDYIRKEIIKKDRKEWFELEQKKQSRNIEFLNKKSIDSQNAKENISLQIVKKQNIINKIIEKIKIIWRKIRG